MAFWFFKSPETFKDGYFSNLPIIWKSFSQGQLGLNSLICRRNLLFGVGKRIIFFKIFFLFCFLKSVFWSQKKRLWEPRWILETTWSKLPLFWCWSCGLERLRDFLHLSELVREKTRSKIQSLIFSDQWLFNIFLKWLLTVQYQPRDMISAP